MADEKCETCWERGRERLAKRHGKFGHLCEDCFNGVPFCRAETAGGGNPIQQRYNKRNREKVRERQRRWRRQNREHVREYWRKWRAAHPKGPEGE